ncbi:MAG TPA: hypothetical protein VGU67_02740 [Edaphobacter sp.]|nr:hypothetical protein [Edaphobacter sp.]
MSKSMFLDNATYARLLQKDDLIVSLPAERDPATMESFANIGGIPFVVDEYAPKSMPVQFRKPRSKKVRIRRKWAKNPRNWKMVNVVWIVDTSKAWPIVPAPLPRSLWGIQYEQSPSDWLSSSVIGLERRVTAIQLEKPNHDDSNAPTLRRPRSL